MTDEEKTPEDVTEDTISELVTEEEVFEKSEAELIAEAKALAEEAGVEVDVYSWQPKTKLGRLVRDSFLGLIPPDKAVDTIEKAMATDMPINEPEIIDILLPNLEDEVLDVNMVQRMTDSGRRARFAVTVAVGNKDGYVGVGRAKGREVGPSIRAAIDRAKLNIIPIKRGCGSWECGCATPHSLPFTVRGKCGSVEVILKPAPKGIGLACGGVAKHILRLAGISDAWSFTRGQTRTTVNFASAVIDALKKTTRLRLTEDEEKKLKIKTGRIGV